MTIYAGSRGSCKNPYGGLINPARIDFVAFVFSLACADSSKQSGVKIFALTQIAHAAADYAFFGFGRNGYHRVEHFFEAVEFLFRTRSYEPETWRDAPAIEQIFVDPESGQRVKSVTVPPPETLQLQCFDKYYEISELDQAMPMEDFLETLKEARRKLILQSRDQIHEYIEFCRRNALSRKGGQLQFAMELLDMDSPEFIETLVYPKSPEEVETILLPFEPLPKRARLRRHIRRKLKRRKSFTYKIAVPYGQQEFVLSDAA